MEFLLLLHRFFLRAVIAVCLLSAASLNAQVSVWTWHGDNLDDNWRISKTSEIVFFAPPV